MVATISTQTSPDCKPAPGIPSLDIDPARVDEVLAKGSFDAIEDLAEAYPLSVFPDAVGLKRECREHLLPYAGASSMPSARRTNCGKRPSSARRRIRPAPNNASAPT